MQKGETMCAIGRDNSNDSCFTLDELHTIAKNYNDSAKDNKKIKLWPTKKEMLVELKEKLTDCSDQTCWPTLKFIKNSDVLNEAFKPNGPAGQFDWLSTTEINECMERYMDVYPDFLFVGAVPIDIEDLKQFGVKNLDYDKIAKKGKTKIGIIYNLDEHYKSGSHWVSLYINLQKYQIYFFDSVGKPPGLKIKKFINKVAKYMYKKKYNIKLPVRNLFKGGNYNQHLKNLLNFDIKYNNIQHQKKNTECGVYSTNFIIRLLEGESFNNIITNITADDKMNEYRKKIFINVN
jgi:hypothetical protein